MKIKKLRKAVDYRIFSDFTWPPDLPEFARFNLIYGWNGSGKSTLSNIFLHLQKQQTLTEGQVEIEIDTRAVAGADFATATLPAVRVFSRDTVDRSIFESGDQRFPPVFYFGEDSVENQRQIEKLTGQLNDKTQEASKWDSKREQEAQALESFCTEKARAVKNLLTAAGGGPYNNYNAGHFRADAKRLLTTIPAPAILTNAKKKRLLVTKDAKALPKVFLREINWPDFLDLTKRVEEMLRRSVVSSVIAELADNPAIAAWANAGLALHSGELATNTCRFCDQPLPEERIRKLEAHFNDEFKRFQADIDKLAAEIESGCRPTKELNIPPKEALYERLRPDYEEARRALEHQEHIGKLYAKHLLDMLEAKRNEPFKKLELRPFSTGASEKRERPSLVEAMAYSATITAVVFISSRREVAWDRLKVIIHQHNEETDGFDSAVAEARKALAEGEVLEALLEWRKRSAALEDAQKHISAAREAAVKLGDTIAALERQVRQHQRPAEELNREMAAYLGRDELRFEVEQNGYRIMRGGHPATHLSDGERTAITFLYFLKSLQGTDFDVKTGVVVVDDPVSSLDANSLFSAFGFMKERTTDVGQLFVLTHNFVLFRQVRNWYCNLPGQKKRGATMRPARFYMLTAEFANGRRTATLQALDPLLYEYESEYHYLFKRVYDEAHKAPQGSLESCYAMPNIARRLLESFLAFRLPHISGGLAQKLDVIECDTRRKTRILRFLHTHSHFDSVPEPDHDLSILSETQAILEDLLALIRACDPGHFKNMTALLAQAGV